MSAERKVPKLRFKEFKDSDAWELCKLGLISEILTGGTPSTQNENFWFPKEVPWMSSGEVHKQRLTYTDDMISIEGLNNSSARWIKKNSVLIALAGQGKTRGSVAINKIPLTTNQSIAAIIPSEIINYEFLYQNLSSRYDELRIISSADGSRGGLNKKLVSDIQIKLPDNIEQHRISEFFLQLDNLITLHQRKLDKLKNLKSAYLSEMFPAEGQRKPKRRFPGFTDDWELRELGEIAKKVVRTDSKSSAPIMMISANYGFINQSERYSYNNAGDSLKKYTILHKNELAYNHGASKIRPFGSTFSLSENQARVPFVYHCFAVEKHDSYFISLILNSHAVEKQLKKMISSSARLDGLLNISMDSYFEVEISVPCINEQIKISKFIQKLDNLITLHQRKLDKLKSMKQAYLNDMFV